jgi:hypothetical protein
MCSVNYGLNLTFLVVTSAAIGKPSWIFNFSISPWPRSAQYRISRSHAGCTSVLVRASDVLRGSDEFKSIPAAMSAILIA